MPPIQLLKPRLTDLGGGLQVRRLLPAAQRQSIGPFVFFDHFGPHLHQPGSNTDVRPHPHIGLATVTYLLEGAMVHRDSLGSVQRIEPGAINWMTAGRGIVHSERAPEDLRAQPHTVHGLQLWAALPAAFEETEPGFSHTPASALPEWVAAGIRVRVLIGEAFGLRSPVATFAPTLYLDVAADPQASLTLTADVPERAIYAISGALDIDGQPLLPQHLAILPPDHAPRITAPTGGRFAVIGGAPLDGPRFIWWNFVSTRRERIEQAREDWRAQRMGHIAGDSEYIPLPG